MNLQHLRYAVEVERTGSITEAADSLFISQPSLSKAIRELETNLGLTIFERTSRGVIPTPKGRELLEYARSILKQISAIEELSGSEEADRQSFSIAIPRGSYIAEGVTRFAATLNYENPYNIRVKETNALQAVSSVADGRFRLAIIRYPLAEESYYSELLKRRGMKGETIWDFEYVVLSSANGPLAGLNRVEEADLKNLVEITHGDSRSPYGESVRGQAAGGRHSFFVYERSTEFELLANLPNTYMWVSPMPLNSLSRYRLVQRKSELEARRQRDLLVFPADYALSGCDRRFIECLYQVKNEVAFSPL